MRVGDDVAEAHRRAHECDSTSAFGGVIAVNRPVSVAMAEQVAEVFGDYYDLGISHFLIRGFDPLIDAIDYGRELIPLTRALIAERQAGRGVAAE